MGAGHHHGHDHTHGANKKNTHNQFYHYYSVYDYRSNRRYSYK